MVKLYGWDSKWTSFVKFVTGGLDSVRNQFLLVSCLMFTWFAI